MGGWLSVLIFIVLLPSYIASITRRAAPQLVEEASRWLSEIRRRIRRWNRAAPTSNPEDTYFHYLAIPYVLSQHQGIHPRSPLLDLPHELLVQILRQNLDVYLSSDVENGVEQVMNEYYKTLRSVSLTCRVLREPAQELLWEHLMLTNEKRAKLVLKNPLFGRYRTDWMRFRGTYRGVHADTARKLLWRVNGLRSLYIVGYSQKGNILEADVLGFASMKDLVHLRLEFTYFKQKENLLDFRTKPLSSLTYPFQLSSLSFNHALFLSPALYIPWINPQLTWLSLNFTICEPETPTQITDLIHLVRTVGPHLAFLKFHWQGPSLASFITLFSTFTNLTSLDFGGKMDDLLLATSLLPTSVHLHRLKIELYMSELTINMATLVQGLRTLLGRPCLVGVRELELADRWFATLRQESEGIEWVAEVQRSGIHLKGWDWKTDLMVT